MPWKQLLIVPACCLLSNKHWLYSFSSFERAIVALWAMCDQMLPMLPDLITKELKVVFCGINPGLQSAVEGHHFSRRSNRFWKVLHQAGFTPHQIEPLDDATILNFGYGLTTAVARATVRADELSKEEFDNSIDSFKTKMLHYKPEYIAFLGKPAFMAFTGKKQITWGLQSEHPFGVKVWVLPNPSGLNRGFTLSDLVKYYRELYDAIQK